LLTKLSIERSSQQKDTTLEVNFRDFGLVFPRTNHYGTVSIAFNSDIVSVFDSLLNLKFLLMK
jgi:hypothetical protein